MRLIGAWMSEQFSSNDDAEIDERQADREQEVDRRTIEKLVNVVALGLRSGEAQQHRNKEEDNILAEYRKQGEEEASIE